MLIGQLVKKTGLTKDTIRFYEKNGLITVHYRERRENNYKEYSEEILQRLLSIKRLKGFGFTLNEVASLLDLMDSNEATCSTVALTISEKVNVLDEKIRELIAVRTMLLKGVKQCADNCGEPNPDANCPILCSDNHLN